MTTHLALSIVTPGLIRITSAASAPGLLKLSRLRIGGCEQNMGPLQAREKAGHDAEVIHLFLDRPRRSLLRHSGVAQAFIKPLALGQICGIARMGERSPSRNRPRLRAGGEEVSLEHVTGLRLLSRQRKDRCQICDGEGAVGIASDCT